MKTQLAIIAVAVVTLIFLNVSHSTLQTEDKGNNVTCYHVSGHTDLPLKKKKKKNSVHCQWNIILTNSHLVFITISDCRKELVLIIDLDFQLKITSN